MFHQCEISEISEITHGVTAASMDVTAVTPDRYHHSLRQSPARTPFLSDRGCCG